MANTLHRDDPRGDAPSIRRLFGDMYDISSGTALAIQTFGKLGYALAFMAEQKVKRAATDKKAAAIRQQVDNLEDAISKAVKPVMAAMSAALPKGNNIDLVSFRLLAANMVCQDELAQVVTLEQRLNEIALAWKDQTISEAITELMGSKAGGSDFPMSSTVYLVQDKDRQWTQLAFEFENSNVPQAIYVQNGEGWDNLNYNLSNPFTEKFFTSKRALLKFAYCYHFLPERLDGMLEQVDDNYNPLAAITPKTVPHIEEIALDDWSTIAK